MLLGAIADDLTGATDLALMLSRAGMRTLQINGTPPSNFDFDDVDAVVVALKSRTIAADMAVAATLEAATALRAGGAKQLFFKYCSTFDSTPEGNIGPVIEALLADLGASFAIACPSFPANGRSMYRGHLFIGNLLLSESPMKDHPLTPMTDANIVRVLQRQTKLKVGLISHDIVSQGPSAVEAGFSSAIGAGFQIAVVDAIDDSDLFTIGHAARSLPLITGGAAIALGLPRNFGFHPKSSDLAEGKYAAPSGRTAIIAGSCSAATRRQIDVAANAGLPMLKIDVLALASGKLDVSDIADWASSQSPEATPLIYSSSNPEDVRAAQVELGREQAGTIIEDILGATASSLETKGFSRFIVAGGETSGAVVNALKVPIVEIGPEIDPGVPWVRSLGRDRSVVLALKSGNFGSDNFFLKARDMLL